MVTIVNLGYEVDTAEVLKGDQALDRLTASTLNADKASKKLAQTSVAAGRNIGGVAGSAANLNVAASGSANSIRLLSLQLSQVVQQAQAGGGILRALAIQLPDIGLAFGTIGIAAGIAGGAILTLADGFLSGSDAADDLEAAMDGLAATAEGLESALNLTRMTGDELVETYGLAAQRVREFALAQAELRAAQAESRLREQVDILGDTVSAYTVAQNAGRDYQNTLNRIEKDLGLTNAQARQFENLLSELGASETFDGQQRALSGILELLDGANIELGNIPPELQRALDEMITLSIETDRARALMAQLAGEAAGVNIGVPLFNQDMNNLLPPPRDQEGGRRARGGRGARDPYEDNLNRLVESLQTERETLEIWYAESEALLNDHRARKLLGEEEYRATMLALEQEYAARQAQLADQTAQHEINAKERAISAVSSLLSVLGGKSRAAALAVIAINKASSIAQAIQNTAVAQTRALAELGPILGPPAAAKIAAFGKLQIAAIAATGLAQAASLGGSGGGGSSSGSGSRGSATARAISEPEAPRRILLDFNGSPSWVEDMFRDITQRIQEDSDAGVIFEVARR